MACERTPFNNPIVNNGYIYKTIARIEQIQKESQMEQMCDGCEGPLNTTFYNTKPVSFYLCNGSLFTATIPNSETTTTMFKIECLKEDCVLLRLLQTTDNVTECTSYTTILCIDCICALQCFDAICCDPCTRTCG